MFVVALKRAVIYEAYHLATNSIKQFKAHSTLKKGFPFPNVELSTLNDITSLFPITFEQLCAHA